MAGAKAAKPKSRASSPSPKKKGAGKGKSGSPDGKKKKKEGGSAGGSPGSDEKKRLQAELAAAAAALRAQEAVAAALSAELAELRVRHGQDAATASDILANQQREKQRLQEAAREAEQQAEAARRDAAAAAAALRAEREAAAAAAAAEEKDDQDSSKVKRMLSCSRQQEERLMQQQREVEGLRGRLARAERRLAESAAEVAALRVRVQGRSELRFVRGAPWLLQVARERLVGALPGAPQPGCSLVVAGRRLVLEGPTASGGSTAGGSAAAPSSGLHFLDLGSNTWAAAAAAAAGGEALPPPPAAPVEGRAVCSVGSRLLGFGGCSGGRLLDAATATQLLLSDLQQWLPAPPPAELAVAQPPPRRDAALAYSPAAGTAYLFGGKGADGRCLADLWAYDLRRSAWTRLDALATSRPQPAAGERARTPCYEAPAPCCGAALAVSDDGSRLWLFGGQVDSGRCSSSLHWFDLKMLYWAAVDSSEAGGSAEPRAHHAMASLGRFLVVAGGMTHTASGTVNRQCVWLYDTASAAWEQLDERAFSTDAASEAGAVVSLAAGRHTPCTNGGSSGSGGGCGAGGGKEGSSGAKRPPAFFGAGTCTFSGSKLLLLRPCPDTGLLGELWSVGLSLPQEVDAAREAHRAAAATVVQRLELACEAVAATSVRLSWRAPAANADKLLAYKLLATDSEGRALEVYQGPEPSCSVQGLAPATELVFALKASFDDGSFLWSEPILVTTPAGGRKPATAAGAKG